MEDITPQKVAQLLLKKRSNPNSFELTGAMLEALTPTGVELGRNRGWLVTNADGTGTTLRAVPSVMQDIIREASNTQKPVEDRVEKARAFFEQHSVRAGVAEAIAAGEIPSFSEPNWKPFELRFLNEEDACKVGDPVVVGEDGRTYTAVVQACNPDGTLTLSFGGEKPKQVKPSYKKEEVQRGAIKPAGSQPSNVPAAEPKAANNGPAGPGLSGQ